MAKKTVLRDMIKYLPVSVELRDLVSKEDEMEYQTIDASPMSMGGMDLATLDQHLQAGAKIEQRKDGTGADDDGPQRDETESQDDTGIEDPTGLLGSITTLLEEATMVTQVNKLLEKIASADTDGPIAVKEECRKRCEAKLAKIRMRGEKSNK